MSNPFPLDSHIPKEHQAVDFKTKGPQPPRPENTRGDACTRGSRLSDFLSRDKLRSRALKGIQNLPLRCSEPRTDLVPATEDFATLARCTQLSSAGAMLREKDPISEQN